MGKVIQMSRYLEVRRAASALKGLLQTPEWLVTIRPSILMDNEAVLEVVVRRDHPGIRSAIPQSVDGLKVVVRVA